MPGASVATAEPPAATTATSATGDVTALAWVRENFAGATWLDAITAIRSVGGALWVDTTLRPGSPLGHSICSAVSAYELDRGKFTGVRVGAADGQRLAMRVGFGDRC